MMRIKDLQVKLGEHKQLKRRLLDQNRILKQELRAAEERPSNSPLILNSPAGPVNVESLKQTLLGLIKSLPSLKANAETHLQTTCAMLKLSAEEVKEIEQARKKAKGGLMRMFSK
jgi:hypothetical protein